MRIKLIENEDGTCSLYNQTEKRFVLERADKDKCMELKKRIDNFRRDKNTLKRGVR